MFDDEGAFMLLSSFQIMALIDGVSRFSVI